GAGPGVDARPAAAGRAAPAAHPDRTRDTGYETEGARESRRAARTGRRRESAVRPAGRDPAGRSGVRLARRRVGVGPGRVAVPGPDGRLGAAGPPAAAAAAGGRAAAAVVERGVPAFA